MGQKIFLPLLDTPARLLVKSDFKPSENINIIKKNDDIEIFKIKKYDFESLNKEKVKIMLIEDKGAVKSIRFECTCGCKTSVELIPEE